MRISISLLCSVLVLLASAGPAPAADSQEKVLKKIRSTFSRIKDFQADLDQQFYWKVLDKKQGMKGTVFMKKPDKFRIELPEMVMVSNGKYIWRYTPQNKQVLKSRVDKSPEVPKISDFVFDFEKSYTIDHWTEERKFHQLDLTPNKEGVSIHGLKIWIDKKSLLLKKIRYLDTNDNETIYTLNRMKINQGQDNARFTFTVPEGVELFETN